ncbi:MAG TPA: carboxymuconolactone decarboxylase family protein [Polyangiales bacterium]|nr:carboxymuconolactone decarboxylase family protein [Polyangiales bacterium]
MEARMKNPALIVPGALQTLLALGAQAKQAGVPETTLNLIYTRASQINGCGYCLAMHAREAKRAGERDERLFTLAGFREAPWFNPAERAALALTEAATRLADRGDGVPDEIWREAREHYDEAQLAALILNIGLINFWNRLNVTTRQVAGTMVPH